VEEILASASVPFVAAAGKSEIVNIRFVRHATITWDIQNRNTRSTIHLLDSQFWQHASEAQP